MKIIALFSSTNWVMKNIAFSKNCNENQYLEFQSCPFLSSSYPPVLLSFGPPARLPACPPALVHAADTTFPFFLDKCCAWKSPTTTTTYTSFKSWERSSQLKKCFNAVIWSLYIQKIPKSPKLYQSKSMAKGVLSSPPTTVPCTIERIQYPTGYKSRFQVFAIPSHDSTVIKIDNLQKWRSLRP